MSYDIVNYKKVCEHSPNICIFKISILKNRCFFPLHLLYIALIVQLLFHNILTSLFKEHFNK